MVRKHDGLNVLLLQIERQQEDVSNRVVFALAGGTEVGYARSAILAKARGFRHVVKLLLFHDMHDVGIALFQFLRQRVAVAHDSVWTDAVGETLFCRTVTATQILGVVENLQRLGVCRKLAVAQYHGVKLFFFHFSHLLVKHIISF